MAMNTFVSANKDVFISPSTSLLDSEREVGKLLAIRGRVNIVPKREPVPTSLFSAVLRKESG
jgi:hypothetical protein